MGQTDLDPYLLNDRSDIERQRLDNQSAVVRAMRDGHVLDPIIPKENVTSVADIATGTGVWLDELTAEFVDNSLEPPKQMIGFDISAGLFPENPVSKASFVEWDMTSRFPEQYHSTFDVVHFRYVLLALKAPKIRGALEKLVELIKPGGYLQWTDATYRLGQDSMFPPGDDHISCQAENDLMYNYITSQDYCLDFTGHLQEIFPEYFPSHVHVTSHLGVSEKNPAIRQAMARWYLDTSPVTLTMVLRRGGKSEEEIAKVVELFEEKVRKLIERGTIFNFPSETLVGQKSNA